MNEELLFINQEFGGDFPFKKDIINNTIILIHPKYCIFLVENKIFKLFF